MIGSLPRLRAPFVGARPRRGSDLEALALAATLTTAGFTHFLAPRGYDRLIPRFLGRPRPWVLGSGAAELLCAALLARPATRRPGGFAAAALFVGVFPGNVTMALRSGRGTGSLTDHRVIAWGRLPLQLPLVWWALRVARGPRSPVV